MLRESRQEPGRRRRSCRGRGTAGLGERNEGTAKSSLQHIRGRFRDWFGATLAWYLHRMSESPESSEQPTPDELPQSAALEPTETAPSEPEEPQRPQGMLPGRERRRSVVERGFVRIIATGGIIGIAAILGAVLVSQDVAGWIVGLAVGLTSVILAALLWSSRQL